MPTLRQETEQTIAKLLRRETAVATTANAATTVTSGLTATQGTKQIRLVSTNTIYLHYSTDLAFKFRALGMGSQPYG